MGVLHFLYHTTPGRIVLKGLTSPGISKLCGKFLDSDLSHFLIDPFISKNKIDRSEYQMDHVRSFNDFFSRKIKPGQRPIDENPRHMIAPCDGLLSVYRISDQTVFPVKQSSYSVVSLLRNRKLAKKYLNGYCFVFRLCVDHYHRYCYVDSGRKSKNVRIPGVLHTVRPVALEKYPVFTENSREYTLIKTPFFGTVVQMEVGAMLVGRIVNFEQEAVVTRGKEKGMFQYGGSTIIVLTGGNRVSVREDLLKNSELGMETSVKMGEMIGYAQEN